MPALEALQSEFAAAGIQTFGISVDSMYSHANWAASLEGVSFPLLQDFQPKGSVAQSYGVYLADAGIADRATVIIDADGVVQHASSVTPAGKRDVDELLRLSRQVLSRYAGKLTAPPKGEGIAGEPVLYVRTGCGFSLRALNARVNLHLEDKVRVENISESRTAEVALEKLTNDDQVPCLVVNGKPMLESEEIVKYLVLRTTGRWD